MCTNIVVSAADAGTWTGGASRRVDYTAASASWLSHYSHNVSCFSAYLLRSHQPRWTMPAFQNPDTGTSTKRKPEQHDPNFASRKRQATENDGASGTSAMEGEHYFMVQW